MAEIDMITPVSEETFKRTVFDAGMLLTNFDYSSAKSAEDLVTLIEAAMTEGTSIMGATKGGVNPQTTITYVSYEVDGKRNSHKGDKRVDSADTKITGTLVEFTPQNVKSVIALADITGEDTNVITVQPRFSIRPGDYIDHVIWISNWGSDGLILVDQKNALCTTGLNSQFTDKDIGTLPFEFTGHADKMNSKELPIKYLFFKSASAAA